jgi:AFG3 family protein
MYRIFNSSKNSLFKGGGPMGGLFNMTKVRPKIKEKSKIKFKDVAGMEEAKVEIKEFVEYLNNPEKFKRLGGKAPRGKIITLINRRFLFH